MIEKIPAQGNPENAPKKEILLGDNLVKAMLDIVKLLQEKNAVEVRFLERVRIFSRQDAIDWFSSVQSRGSSATLLHVLPGENIGKIFTDKREKDASVALEIEEITLPATASPVDALVQMIGTIVRKTPRSYIEGVAVNASMGERKMFLTDIEIAERLNRATS